MRGINLEGAGVLLTGASSGIGRATARRLAEQGARLVVAARSAELLESLATEIEAAGGIRPRVVVTDLARRGAAAELAAAARQHLGVVDVLVNNAGGGVGGAQWAVADGDAAREAFEVNHWSPLALIAELVPAMRERGAGAVVNVTSVAQVTTWPGFGGYAATKSAFAQATRTLDMELHGSGVLLVEVIPGPVNTAVQAETRLIPGIERMLARSPLGDPDVLARHIVRALEKGRRRVVYPRQGVLPLAFPRIAHRYTRRLAARAAVDLDASLLSTVVRSGSHGDEVARQARAAWESAIPGPSGRAPTYGRVVGG